MNDTYNKVFFHISDVQEKYIEVGDEVMFDLFIGPKGYYAESIEFLNLDGEDSDSEPDEAVNQEVLLNGNACNWRCDAISKQTSIRVYKGG